MLEGSDLVEDATIEVAGLEGFVDLLLGLPLWRVLAAGGECWIEFHDSLLLLIVVSDWAAVSTGGGTRDTAAPIEKQVMVKGSFPGPPAPDLGPDSLKTHRRL